jgi:lanthanide-dependent methanol dehydrogenase
MAITDEGRVSSAASIRARAFVPGWARCRAMTWGAVSILGLAFACTGAANAQLATIAPAATTPDDGTWTLPAKDYASTRYSALDQIKGSNVGALRVEFAFSTGVARGQEAAPLVADDTMFIVTPFPNVVYALDLTRPGAPPKWKYEPKPDASAQGVACCDVVNRGASYANGRVFFNTLDGDTIALDARTGAQVWRTHMGDIHKGETMTMAPLVVKDKVLVGDAGGEFGVRGWLAALDTGDGHVVWKAYHTGPDKDVLIGDAFKPFYAMDRGKDLGISTWPPDAWKIGGGTAWGWISYDPQSNLIYYGTSNPSPWNSEVRAGDNKWTSGLFARDADTGQAHWFYQFSPHDHFDYDAVNESILLDMPVQGKVRKVLVRAERNGYVYVMDRATGEVLSADAYGTVNSSLGVDLKTGRLRYNSAKTPHVGTTVRDICPTSPGAKDWNPSAFSPRTGLLYVPHLNLCMDYEAKPVNYIEGTPYVGADLRMYAGPGGHRGELIAWDPVARKVAWKVDEDLPIWSAMLATAGDLVFYGTMDGWFKAVDARTGEQRWSFPAGSGIIGQPISYKGPDGRQYVAVLAGVGGWTGAVVVGHLDTRDKSAAMGMVGAMSDLPSRTQPGGTLYVFALPPS